MSITLRLVNEIEGCLHYQHLSRMVWGSPEEDLCPTHVLITIAKSGGGLLGAYADDGPTESGGMIGAALWWLGTVTPIYDLDSELDNEVDTTAPPDLRVYSHQVGVAPAWQGRGIGARLKLEQRRLTLKQGLTERMSWTYDPLYLPNSIFNLNRLGAVCNVYRPNFYGEMLDELNKGTPSDRCELDWFLRSPRVEAAAAGTPIQRDWLAADLQILPSKAPATDADFRHPIDNVKPDWNGDPVAVPAPEDIAAIRRADKPLSLAWRLNIRENFQSAFANGYLLVDCVNLPDLGWCYILENQE